MFAVENRSYLYRKESVRLHRRKSVSALIEQEAPTTAPKDWPGTASSRRLDPDQMPAMRLLFHRHQSLH